MLKTSFPLASFPFLLFPFLSFAFLVKQSWPCTCLPHNGTGFYMCTQQGQYNDCQRPLLAVLLHQLLPAVTVTPWWCSVRCQSSPEQQVPAMAKHAESQTQFSSQEPCSSWILNIQWKMPGVSGSKPLQYSGADQHCHVAVAGALRLVGTGIGGVLGYLVMLRTGLATRCAPSSPQSALWDGMGSPCAHLQAPAFVFTQESHGSTDLHQTVKL